MRRTRAPCWCSWWFLCRCWLMIGDGSKSSGFLRQSSEMGLAVQRPMRSSNALPAVCIARALKRPLFPYSVVRRSFGSYFYLFFFPFLFGYQVSAWTGRKRDVPLVFPPLRRTMG